MSLKDFLIEHSRLETVEVPNRMLDGRGRLARWILRQTLKVRYMPKFSEVEIHSRFSKQLKLTGDEELALFQAFDRFDRKEQTADDARLVLSYQDKVENINILSALYSAVVVEPRMTEKKMEQLLRRLTKFEFAEFVKRMDKYVKVTEEVNEEIKNSSAPKRSHI